MNWVVAYCIFVSTFCYLSILTWNSLIGFWLVAEIGSLIILPLFFYGNFSNRYLLILIYIVMSSLSSVLFLIGSVFENLQILVFLGLCLKSGIVPFTYWMLLIYSGVNWYIFFLMAVVSKSFLIYSNTFLHFLSVNINIVCFFVIATLLFNTVIICSGLNSFKQYIAISSISSGTLMFYLVFDYTNNWNSIFNIFVIYGFITFFAILFYNYFDSICLDGGYTLLVSFMILSLPFSLLFFYKVFWLQCLMSGGAYLLLVFWYLSSVVEQWYIFNYLIEKSCLN